MSNCRYTVLKNDKYLLFSEVLPEFKMKIKQGKKAQIWLFFKVLLQFKMTKNQEKNKIFGI